MKKLTYIAGPCAAESEQQVLETARALVATGDIIFRAGVWKPRTRPDTFQGVGDEGLLWLSRVKNELHVPVATEVVTAEQVTKALEAGIDYLWIGARTSANPIAVATIADAIRIQNTEYRVQNNSVCALSAERSVLGQPKAVFIKNPVNADAALWLGNIERLEAAGVPVTAVHRGCSHQPYWEMAHHVRVARPDIPMLLDPSHMIGDAELVPSLSRVANELEYDGLMVEVHPHPEQALSDAQQQITPEVFAAIRRAPVDTYSTPLELRWLRKMIDEVDDRLWNDIAQRMAVSQRIGEFKKTHQMEVVQPTRFNEIMTKRLAWAERHGLSKEAVQAILETIHQESIRVQH